MEIYYGNIYFNLFMVNIAHLSFNSAVRIWILILWGTVHKVKNVHLEAFFAVEKQVKKLIILVACQVLLGMLSNELFSHLSAIPLPDDGEGLVLQCSE